MIRIPVIIDCDPGVDDFFCLAIAAANRDKLDIKGVTTIGGNNYTKVTTKNALDILYLFGAEDIPVYAGADRYLASEFGTPSSRVHGSNGVGELVLTPSPQKCMAIKAWDFIISEAMEQDGDLILVTVGPLTNIALAFLKFPALPNYIKKIVCMGGSSLEGNVNSYGEANIIHDALAAKIVFNSGIPIDMVGLHATHDLRLDPEFFDSFVPDKGQEIRQIMRHLLGFIHGDSLYDAIAMATLIDDSWVEWKETRIDVEAHSGKTMGWTMAASGNLEKSERIHRMSWRMDREGYYRIFRDMTDKLVK
ncbi:MAG: nucleoside hydrolase [Oscillospiraceae bacterium]|nr:nucleoside hydrolase [Oscillospiraceae bacterium]